MSWSVFTRGTWAAALSLILGTTALHAQESMDTTAAITALSDYTRACRLDGGRLWGLSLCGPLILVEPESRWAVANEQPPGGEFTRHGPIWTGHVPGGIPVSNTALTWVGRKWAIARLPLSGDRFSQVGLLLHESFHRIQDTLGLGGPDLLNPHLDERDGRYWLRLELRAEARSLTLRGPDARQAALDALLFRANRHRLYPGADTLERALELQEGLAEYTGQRLAMAVTGESPARAARTLAGFESRETFVRSVGYATGPALGLLLDRYAPGWRSRVRTEGLAPQLARALRFEPPADLAGAARARAAAYDDGSLAREEDQRETERQARLADYRRRLVEGPVIVLRQDRLSRAFNPNTLTPLGDAGTVYPTGVFSAEWGKLEVSEGGALVAPDFGMLRIPAPDAVSGSVIKGEGWTLELADGWRLVPGARAGDYRAAGPEN